MKNKTSEGHASRDQIIYKAGLDLRNFFSPYAVKNGLSIEEMIFILTDILHDISLIQLLAESEINSDAH
jgi:hypothetical protein